MPTTPTVPRPSPTAARAAAVPFLPTARSRTRRGGLRGPAYGGHPTPRRGRSSAALDLAPPGRLDARALWVGVLSRDDPRGPAPPQALVEESQEGPVTANVCKMAIGHEGRIYQQLARWCGRTVL